MSQAIPVIDLNANIPYNFVVPESPSPATYLIVTNSGAVPIQWNIGSNSGHIPNGMTVAISVNAAGTQVGFTSDQNTNIYITVWTQSDGQLRVPQGAPISSVEVSSNVNATIINNSVPINGTVAVVGDVTTVIGPITNGFPNLGSTPTTPTTLADGALTVTAANQWQGAYTATNTINITELQLQFSVTTAGDWFAFRILQQNGGIIPLGSIAPVTLGIVSLAKHIQMNNGDGLQAASSTANTQFGFWGMNWI